MLLVTVWCFISCQHQTKVSTDQIKIKKGRAFNLLSTFVLYIGGSHSSSGHYELFFCAPIRPKYKPAFFFFYTFKHEPHWLYAEGPLYLWGVQRTRAAQTCLGSCWPAAWQEPPCCCFPGIWKQTSRKDYSCSSQIQYMFCSVLVYWRGDVVNLYTHPVVAQDKEDVAQ